MLRTGKALARDRKEISVHFKPVPHLPSGPKHSFSPTGSRSSSIPIVWPCMSTSTVPETPVNWSRSSSLWSWLHRNSPLQSPAPGCA